MLFLNYGNILLLYFRNYYEVIPGAENIEIASNCCKISFIWTFDLMALNKLFYIIISISELILVSISTIAILFFRQ